jgi:hypothetical protein
MTDVFLLLIDMPDLEPDISVSKRTGRIAKDAIKACEGFLKFALLFVDDPKSEEYFVGFIKILITQVSKTRREIGRSHFTFVHAENGRESFLSMVEGTIAIVENAYTVPKFWILLRSTYKK